VGGRPVALDERQLTRDELAVEVARITGVKGLDDKLKGGFGDLLKPAAFRGDLCFAPSDGQRVRFARPDQWLGRWKPVGTDEATLEVARRYLTRYGPASREALARWFGMPSPAEAGRWLKRLGDEAVAFEDGTYLLAADVEALSAAEPTGVVRLLPAFDHYVVAAPRRATATTWCGRTPARACTGRRGGCRRSCWSTGGWPACGRTSARAPPWRSRSSRSRVYRARCARAPRRRPRPSPRSSAART
jgi:hypothetical protein